MWEFARTASITFSSTDSFPTITFLTWSTTSRHVSAASPTFNLSRPLYHQSLHAASSRGQLLCEEVARTVTCRALDPQPALALARHLQADVSLSPYPSPSQGSPSQQTDLSTSKEELSQKMPGWPRRRLQSAWLEAARLELGTFEFLYDSGSWRVLLIDRIDPFQ